MLKSGKQLGQWVLTIVISLVWLINGLYCKILGIVPSHEQIVASILGATHAHTFTICIGIAEVIMAIWSIRLFIQLFVYSSKLWKGKTFETAMHVLFTLLWIYLVVVFGSIGLGYE